jgi:hypothetical protein
MKKCMDFFGSDALKKKSRIPQKTSYWNIWKKNQKQSALGIPCCCIPSGWASNGKNR